jgi:ethanolaminephosphotransferase
VIEIPTFDDVSSTYDKLETRYDSTPKGYFYYLNADARKDLLTYQYHGSDNSLLYQYILSPFAQYCVDHFVPGSMAPNSITLFALLWMVTAYVACWWFVPTLEANDDSPRWIFLWTAVSLFAYQTLDNMDGKQARKTGSCSPVGLLFDHGCDAINSIFGSANWIIAMGLSLEEDTLGIMVLIMIPFSLFYIATWEEYYVGELILPIFNGPSEGLLMGVCFHLTTFLKGTTYWKGTEWYDTMSIFLPSTVLPDDPVRNMDFVLLATLFGGMQEIILKVTSVTKKYEGSAFSLVPFVTFFLGFITIGWVEPSVWLSMPRTGMHLSMILFVEMTTELMLAHMTNQKFQWFRWQLLPLAALAIVMGTYAAIGDQLDVELIKYLVGAYTWSIGAYLVMKMVLVIQESCDVLNVWCFDIVTPRREINDSKSN